MSNQILQCLKTKEKPLGHFKGSKKTTDRLNRGKYKVYQESNLEFALKIKQIM